MEEPVPQATLEEFARLVFGAMGILVMTRGVLPFQGMLLAALYDFPAPDGEVALAWSKIGLATTLPVGAGLILFRARLARSVAPPHSIGGVSRRDALALILAGVGAWTFISGLSGVVRGVSFALNGAGPDEFLAGAGVMLIAGVLLFLGSRGLAGVWERLRYER